MGTKASNKPSSTSSCHHIEALKSSTSLLESYGFLFETFIRSPASDSIKPCDFGAENGGYKDSSRKVCFLY